MPKLSGSNFLDKFVSLFEGTEVPELFAMWGGISCISAMLERRVWIDMNIYKIFPNQFIIFVADSGRMRKSTAIKMTRRLLSKTSPGPRLIAQKITPEALIDSLRVIRTDDPKQIMDETCGGLVIADELVSFINRDTYERGLGGLMIELWDCPDKYEYRTRNREPEEINFGHLSLLGGTTVHTLRDAIPIQAMGDGFSSRVLFVYVDEAPIPVPRPTRKPHFARTETELVDHLQSISKISGEIKLTDEAIELFDQEYIRFFHSKMYDDPQFQAYASRRDKHMLKVAICLMAAEHPKGPLEITRMDLEGARIAIEDIEQSMGHVFERIAMTETGSMTEKVYNTIKTATGHMILKSELLRKFSHRLNASELTKIIETLTISKRVTAETMPGDSTRKLYYKISDDPNNASDNTL